VKAFTFSKDCHAGVVFLFETQIIGWNAFMSVSVTVAGTDNFKVVHGVELSHLFQFWKVLS
jgi:hypothetical protein